MFVVFILEYGRNEEIACFYFYSVKVLGRRVAAGEGRGGEGKVFIEE